MPQKPEPPPMPPPPRTLGEAQWQRDKRWIKRHAPFWLGLLLGALSHLACHISIGWVP